MRNSRIFGMLGGVFLLGFAFGQQPLSLKQMTDSVLERNYAIRLVRITEESAAINNTPGAAGMSPSVGFVGSLQGSSNNTRQEYFSGDVRQANNAQNRSKNAAVQVNWTLFNGFYVQHTRDMLKMQEQLAHANTVVQMENELFSAASLYYEIIARKELLANLDSTLRYSRLRFELAEKQLQVGKGNRLEFLQSQLDLQADSAQWLQQKTQLKNLYLQLARQMGANPDLSYQLDGSFSLPPIMVLEDIKKLAQKQNSQVRLLKLQERLSNSQLQRTKSARYPRLDIFTNYSFVNSQNAVGVLKQLQSLGPSAGLNVSYNIFNGNLVNRQIEQARLDVHRVNLQQEQNEYNLDIDVRQAFENYLLHRNLAEFEQKNQELAMENLHLARIQLSVGAITPFQFRDVQLVQLAVESRYAQALFDLKVAELELMRLSGGLLQFLQSEASN
ncbi:MAG: hypothetical protein GC180_08480 [Bacteroidetes bacterium]|nr:hypothetical protein [Bacteroidota bacterium]